MIKQILIGLVGISSLPALCQGTFEKYYQATGAKLNLNELSSGNYLTGMAWEGGTSLLNAQGDIVHTKSYVVDTILILKSVRKASNNEFYFCTAYYKDPCGGGRNQYPLIGKIDSLGTILMMRYFPLNGGGCLNIARDLEVLSDKCVIVWGGDQQLYLLRADSNLFHSWSRYYDMAGLFHFVKELPSGDLLAGFDTDTAGASLMRLDSNGNILWCKSYFRPDGGMHDAVIESDSSFVVVGYSPPPARKVFLMKVNGNGDLQWSRGFHATQAWNTMAPRVRINRALDGNYVLLASTGSMLGSGRPWMLKADANGDTLWVRRYGVNGVGYDIADLLATTDGGFIFDGHCFPWGTYIFKSDSLGHIPCSEDPPPPLYITALFPVDSNITLTSVDGAIIYPAYAQDTTYAPIAVTDGCTVTHVPVVQQVTKPRIRPNPTPGRFTVQFTDPLVDESYYSVYDNMGRLLYQRPWPKGMASEEIDLGRFGSGTYVLKLTTPEGVCTERVLVSP
jgi:hypothetical protein